MMSRRMGQPSKSLEPTALLSPFSTLMTKNNPGVDDPPSQIRSTCCGPRKPSMTRLFYKPFLAFFVHTTAARHILRQKIVDLNQRRIMSLKITLPLSRAHFLVTKTIVYITHFFTENQRAARILQSDDWRSLVYCFVTLPLVLCPCPSDKTARDAPDCHFFVSPFSYSHSMASIGRYK